MEREELMQLIGSLRTEENSDTRNGILDQINDAVNAAYDNTDRLITANNEYIRANEQLRSANMKLFMKIGENPLPKAEEPHEDKPEKKLTFEDLFKEEK